MEPVTTRMLTPENEQARLDLKSRTQGRMR
jgi:hypothetical protein